MMGRMHCIQKYIIGKCRRVRYSIITNVIIIILLHEMQNPRTHIMQKFTNLASKLCVG